VGHSACHSVTVGDRAGQWVSLGDRGCYCVTVGSLGDSGCHWVRVGVIGWQ
jgi:hypothetical protein